MKIDAFTKWTVLLNCLVPVTLLGWDAARGQLGANPVNFSLHTTGILALLFLVLTLAVTPLSRFGGWGWLGQFRRMLGLNAFFHTALHFLIFYWYDRAADLADTLKEIVLRPYLFVGTVGLLIMAPLAATSTNAMIKRLGPARWKALHRLTYVAAVAGAVHYYWLVKADVGQPIEFAAGIGILLSYRLGWHYWQLRSDAVKYRTAPPAPPAMAVQVPARPKPYTGRLRVARVFDETPEVRTFRFVADASARLPFEFLPGQYLNITLPIEGQKVRRSYTIASAPTRLGYCEITVKREAQGLASRHLHDNVRAGDFVDVIAPGGRFTFTGAEAGSVVMIAGGVGITPLMAKIRFLTDLCWPGDIYLILSAKTERDIIFRDELAVLCRRHPNLHLTITLTREDRPEWTGERGRISPELLTRVVPKLETRRVHMCGPTEMTDPIRKILGGLGVPDTSIFIESFASPSRMAATPAGASAPAAGPAVAEQPAEAGEQDGGGEATLTFARSGKTLPASKDRTVLEMAESVGVAIDYDCRAAVCGRCKTRLISGRVVMDADDALDARDRANNLILACQARCVDQVTVDA